MPATEMSILGNKAFAADYERLRSRFVYIDEHTNRTAYEHCELVRKRARELAVLNELQTEDAVLLDDMACLHEIGRAFGSANESRTLELLPNYGVTGRDRRRRLLEALGVPCAIVNRYFCVRQGSRGIPDADFGWDALPCEADLLLLCLFMIAAASDHPNGWKASEGLVWFVEEVLKRGLVSRKLITEPVGRDKRWQA